MTQYERGANFERRVKKLFENRSPGSGGPCFVIRSSGSHGPVDISVFQMSKETLFIQCKKDGKIDAEEKCTLIRLASTYGAIPMLASRNKDMPGGVCFEQLWE